MKAVMYGAGNIGRGFLGQLFFEAGYNTTFIDVNEAVVDAINARRSYYVRIISNTKKSDAIIENVSAIDGSDNDAVIEAISTTDIMATAVGVRVLPIIAPIIAKGLLFRRAKGKGTLDIIICENMIDANLFLKSKITERLSFEEAQWIEQNIGFVEASVGRMVPIQDESMNDGDILRVCVEEYKYLPVDASAFRGELPSIKTLIPYSPFAFFIKRKLFVHNMGHALCAYFGNYINKQYIYESISCPAIRIIAQNAMLESALSLLKQYDMPPSSLIANIHDLLYRFQNAALGDTCARVGGDTARKLAENDRLVGAAQNCITNGITPSYIAAGIAAGLYTDIALCNRPQSEALAMNVLKEYSGLDEKHELVAYILPVYKAMKDGRDIIDVLAVCDNVNAKTLTGVI